MAGNTISLKQMRAQEHARVPPRLGWRVVALFVVLEALLLVALSLVFGGPASAEPVKGDVKVATDGGYARLIFRLDEDVDASVRVNGAIIVITFKKPIAVAVDRMNAGARDYISAARRDPDGSAIRIALARKVKVNSIAAGERLFVDLLPEDWQGLPPGLPQEVIEELSRRTREAERQLRQQRLTSKQRSESVILVKVAAQPTFTRYIFDLPDAADVVPERAADKFTLNFNQPLKFDLADAKATLPSTLQAIDAKLGHDSVAVTFLFNGKPEVRSFREDRSIAVDVGNSGVIAKPAAPEGSAIRPAETSKDNAPAIAAPETVPAKGVPTEPQTKPSASAAEAMRAPAVAPVIAPPPTPGKADEPVKPPVAAAEQPAPTPAAAKPEPAADPKAKAETVPPAERPRRPVDPNTPVTVNVHRHGDNLRLEFPFAAPTAAAVFLRADTLWLVFDSGATIDVAALTSDESRIVRGTVIERGKDGETIVRIRLDRPRLASLSADDTGWMLSIGDTVTEPTRPLAIARSIVGKNRSSIAIPFAEPRQLHRIVDPDIGDTLMVITALGPARGFLKPQDFVDLRALASTHGIVVQPLADDLSGELAADKVVISRPGGLTLSAASSDEHDSGNFRSLMFDTQIWGFDREAKFNARQTELIGKAASAPESKRRAARLALARFYLARDMSAEAKAVLDVIIADDHDGSSVTGVVLKAIANVMLDRPEEALKDLANSKVGNQNDAPIWRAVAHARQGKWGEAREGFRKAEGAMAALPIELQRVALRDAVRSSIEVRDFNGAANMLNEFETLGVPPEMAPSIAILTGRLAEGLGRTGEALAAYGTAAASRDRRYAAQGYLRDVVLRFKAGDIKSKDVINELERITSTWRGDETEVEGLQLLAHLYTKDKRYRNAFHVMRTALLAHPNSDLTRKIQDEAATTFDSLFLSDQGDAMPAIEALGLFYDYRELTPIGRRGDEMIRRLADRLVSVDLLDQAAELLQHQVTHRLQGAARAQVATRLAVVYLMNRKPDRALASLRETRISDLSSELRDQRLLLEARALSDIGRHEIALEIIDGMQSREAMRLRSDVLWAAKRWRDTAEQIELLYGERWKEFKPLTAEERADVLRAAIGYALSEEPIGLARFREKYAAKMADGPDRRAFEVVTAPTGTSGAEFRDVASMVAGMNTLDAFLRDLHTRYPDKDAVVPAAGAPPKPEDNPDTKADAKSETNSTTTPEKKPPAGAPVVDKISSNADAEKPKPSASPLPPKPPSGTPLKPDPAPTGSIPRLPKRRAQ